MIARHGTASLRSSQRRRALTLIELLVVLSIIGILAALLIPAVGAVREISRSTACVNNLRQMGLALANYESANGRFPAGTTTLRLSPHAAILPFLEQAPLYSQINLSIKIYGKSWDLEFHTIASYRISTFVCPSDTGGLEFLKLNYSACAGWNQESDSTRGVFPRDRTSSTVASIRDGLSNTLAFSERLRSIVERDGPQASIRPTFLVPPNPLTSTFEAYMASCRGVPDNLQGMKPVVKGVVWICGDRIATSHDHNNLPNTLTCWCGSEEGHRGSIPASSAHRGIVNGVFADGHIRSLRTTVDLAVWRAISTRAGNDTISGGE